MAVSAGPPRTGRTIMTQKMDKVRRVELRDPANWGELVVEPAERVSFTVEGPPDIVERVRARVDGETLRIGLGGSLGDRVRDALTTSLSRRHVTYRVRAPHLDRIRVFGLVQVDSHAFGAEAPIVAHVGPTAPFAQRPPAPSGSGPQH
jgi:hypothetical protein